MTSHQPPAARSTLLFLLTAVFLSGFAAIVNQTVWQRALKIYLAGCESASSMIIVLVFMLGLGLGSLLMGFFIHRVKNSLRTLALVELLLFAMNALVAYALSLDLSETIYAMQRSAVAMGIPLRLVYGISATAVLSVPCILMGMTMPLVSDATQHLLRCESKQFILTSFVLNTIGSVLGCIAGGFLLLPFFGQQTALVLGAACNLAAAGILFALYFARFRGSHRTVDAAALEFRSGAWTLEEMLGFWLGFLSLAYEMYLFRIASLAHRPVPYNFSIILGYFLLFWSIGLYLSSSRRESLTALLLLCAALMAAVPAFYFFDRRALYGGITYVLNFPLSILFSGIVYCLPCLVFGCLFGRLISQTSSNWGSDVGRFYAMNTLGSCLGVLAMTWGGFEISPTYCALLISGGYLALFLVVRRRNRLTDASAETSPRLVRFSAGTLVVSLLVVLPVAVILEYKPSLLVPVVTKSPTRSYYGRDGVIEIVDDRDVLWDGFWHARLTDAKSLIGTNDWLFAVTPLLCRYDRTYEDSLIIGLGTGQTAATLARSNRVRSIDGYEINHELENVLRDYPEKTARVSENPKVHILWQDGRSGMALNDKKYDLITQAPLYLRQAGSSALLSYEHMSLAKSRLKPGGIYCIYSNSNGNQEQSLLVRNTVKAVFPYYESFNNGYLIVASTEPFTYDPELALKSAETDPLLEELRSVGAEKLRGYLDSPRLRWDAGNYLISDDHPLVEFPAVVTWLLSGYTRKRTAE